MEMGKGGEDAIAMRLTTASGSPWYSVCLIGGSVGPVPQSPSVMQPIHAAMHKVVLHQNEEPLVHVGRVAYRNAKLTRPWQPPVPTS